MTGSSDAPFLSHAYSEDLGELSREMLSQAQPVTSNDSSFSPRARRVWWTPSGVDVDILLLLDLHLLVIGYIALRRSQQRFVHLPIHGNGAESLTT